MKNKEKYAKEIVDAVTGGGYGFGFNKYSGEIRRCNEISCVECLFCESHGSDECNKMKKEWAESEYIEKPVISKKDRAFLEYIGKELKYIARSKSDNLMAFQNSAEKRGDGWGIGSGEFKSLKKFNIDFPMVKWSDGKPWLIEDLKKLEVVEEYE